MRTFLITAMTLIMTLASAADEWQAAEAAFASGDLSEAFELTLPLAEAGDIDARNRMAHLYRYGEGTPLNYEQAVFWSQKAADQGSGYAMMVLSALYRTGNGVPKDEAEADRLLEDAAEHGDALANYNLYVRARKDAPDGSNDALALSYLEKSVELGGADGQFALGGVYFQGLLGLPQDRKKALEYATLAAEQRHIEGLTFASGLLAHTEWAEKVDYPLSAVYLRVAFKEGCAGVGKQLTLLLKAMPVADLMESDQRVADWLERHQPAEPHRHRAPPPVCEMPLDD